MNWQNRYMLGLAVACAGIAVAASFQRVSAQDAAAGPAPKKIAVFNRKSVFDNYKTRITEDKALRDEVSAKQAELDKLRDQIVADRKKAREDNTLTEEQQRELVEKITSEERDYEDKFRRVQGDINDKGTKFYSRILGQIDDGVRDFGKAQGYVVILDSDPKASNAVLYFDKSLDQTEAITTHLNSK